MGSVGRRPAPSGGVQRHLAGRPRLPGERAPLPRRRHPAGDQLRRRSAKRRAAGSGGRLRPDGTIVPRNSLIAPAQNRTDLRLQQRIPLHGRTSIDAIAEVFNIFNRPNYGIGTQENNVAVPAERHGPDAHDAVWVPVHVLSSKFRVQSAKVGSKQLCTFYLHYSLARRALLPLIVRHRHKGGR